MQSFYDLMQEIKIIMSIIISPIAKKENKTHNLKKDYEDYEEFEKQEK